MTLSSQKHVLLYFSITVSIHSSDSYFKRFPVIHAATQRSVLGCTHCRSTDTSDRCHPRTVLSQNSPPTAEIQSTIIHAAYTYGTLFYVHKYTHIYSDLSLVVHCTMCPKIFTPYPWSP